MTSFLVCCIWYGTTWRAIGRYIQRRRSAKGENCEWKCKEFCVYVLGRKSLETFVRIYVIHFLGTYVTILCNWLILWQNALYLYLGRFRMCLILQETVFQDQVLKPCKSIQDCYGSSTIYIERLFLTCHVGYCYDRSGGTWTASIGCA